MCLCFWLILFFSDLQRDRITHTKLAARDPGTALFLTHVYKKSKVPKTKANYASLINKFIKYAISVDCNPFFHNLDPILIVYFLLYRIRDNDSHSWNSEIAAISWFCELIGSSVEWKVNPDLLNIKFKITKLFFVEPSKAEPLFLDIFIDWFVAQKFDISKVNSIPFDLLAKYTIIQIFLLSGMRGMEVLKYNTKKSTNGIKLGNILRCLAASPDDVSYYKLTIKGGEYKNAIFAMVDKVIIIGDSKHNVLNPYILFNQYIKRLKLLKLSNDNINTSSNANVFQFFNGKIITLNIARDWLQDILLDLHVPVLGKKYTLHGFRSGFATWLRGMNMKIEKICALIGWSTKFLGSSSFGYFRFSDSEKAEVASQAVLYRPTSPLNLICALK